jgi:hypothetical protein
VPLETLDLNWGVNDLLSVELVDLWLERAIF